MNSPKKAQLSSLKIINLAGIITEIFKVLDEYIALNRRNKKVFLRLGFIKITVTFCI